jgi:hypothetical protein
MYAVAPDAADQVNFTLELVNVLLGVGVVNAASA